VLDNPQLGEGELDRRDYSFCVLEALQAALDRRDAFVARSGRFTDPRAHLLSGPAWTAARPEICAGLSLEPDSQQALDRLGAQLDGAYRQTAERLPENVALQIAELAGADRPDLTKLEALAEPEQLSRLRATTTAMLPARVAFSEVLLEVCRWTGFADAFAHLSEGLARAEDLHISICAVLLADACNISLAEVANPGVPALSPNRLSWVSQNYVRAETIAAANELLLDVYRRIPLVHALGDGHIATVDGMRFPVPVRSIHTGPNPRYFARGRGHVAELPQRPVRRPARDRRARHPARLAVILDGCSNWACRAATRRRAGATRSWSAAYARVRWARSSGWRSRGWRARARRRSGCLSTAG
jgi:hypothetical protein